METFSQPGKLEQIIVRSRHRGEVLNLKEAEALAGLGIAGDHRASKQTGLESKRQVSLIQAEHLRVVASMLGHETPIEASLCRRNLVLSGINLLALKAKRFSIGEAIFEGTGLCHPCSRMEENLGTGGYNAMRGHGGITAIVLRSGHITLGDLLKIV